MGKVEVEMALKGKAPFDLQTGLNYSPVLLKEGCSRSTPLCFCVASKQNPADPCQAMRSRQAQGH
jgi:hypothetical protein